MQTLIRKCLVLWLVLAMLLLSGCSEKIKDIYYDWNSQKELTADEVKVLVDGFNPADFDVCELLKKEDWYGGPEMTVYKNERIVDNTVISIDAFMGVVRSNGEIYCTDPFDDYFDKVREIRKNHDLSCMNLLMDKDLENNATQPYLIYLMGAFETEEQIKDFEKEYGVSNENNYHTAICSGVCKVKDVFALFGIESSDETTIDMTYSSSGNKEGSTAAVSGLRIKQIDTVIINNSELNIYLIKLEN